MDPIIIIQVLSSVIIIIATISGGIWTFYRFRKLREVKKALSIQILPTIHHQRSYSIVEIKIDFSSNGTVPVYVPKRNISKCILHVKVLPTVSKDTILSLEDKRHQKIVPPIEYFNHYELAEGEFLILEPGVKSEVHGYGILITKTRGLILLHVEFYDEEDFYWTEGIIIDTR